MKKQVKTNAARLLDKMEIAYELLTYVVDEEDLGAENVCAKLNVDLKTSVKTLVLKGDRLGVLVACLPGSEEIDLKKLALLSGNKKVDMVPQKDIHSLTGYLRGGVSPLAMKKQYPTFLEQQVLDNDLVIVSAGMRGLQLHLKAQDLALVLGPTIGSLIKQ